MTLFPPSTPKPKPVFRSMAFWEGVRNDYIQGKGSTRELAAKHGVSLATLQARCEREEWVLERAEYFEVRRYDLATDGKLDV